MHFVVNMKRFPNDSAGRKPSRAVALVCVPVRNADVEAHRSENGEVLLSYPATVRPWLGRFLKGLGQSAYQKYTKRLQLDALGSEVWELLDGKRSVRQIIRCFREKHQLHPKEAEVSVSQFLRELGKRGIIGLS